MPCHPIFVMPELLRGCDYAYVEVPCISFSEALWDSCNKSCWLHAFESRYEMGHLENRLSFDPEALENFIRKGLRRIMQRDDDMPVGCITIQ